MQESASIFREYYTEADFDDRYERDPALGITVIIPVIHTNELWEANLRSIYREIPVARLLIGDGGCIDDSVAIAKSFPRVEVLDHRAFKSLGYSIRKMIEAVETEWFAYFHSDVYLPTGWFDEMLRYRDRYDWYGCRMRHTVMVEYDLDYDVRPYAGTQLGRTAYFADGVKVIDDDYVYRQEDFIFSDVLRRAGGREGKVDDVFHYHQTMRKPSPWSRKVTNVAISVETSPEEDLRTWDMQTRGIVKYLQPDNDWVIGDAGFGLFHLKNLGAVNVTDFYKWVQEVNPIWIPHLRKEMFWRTMRAWVETMLRSVKRLLRRFR